MRSLPNLQPLTGLQHGKPGAETGRSALACAGGTGGRWGQWGRGEWGRAVVAEVGTAGWKSSGDLWRLTQNWSQKEMKLRGDVNPGRKADGDREEGSWHNP